MVDFANKIETAAAPPPPHPNRGTDRAKPRSPWPCSTRGRDRPALEIMGLAKDMPRRTRRGPRKPMITFSACAYRPKGGVDERYAIRSRDWPCSPATRARDARGAAGARAQGWRGRPSRGANPLYAARADRCLGANAIARFPALLSCPEAVVFRRRRCRPPSPAPDGDERTLCARPGRGAAAGVENQHRANSASDPDGALPHHARHDAGLAPGADEAAAGQSRMRACSRFTR